jgi:hypothetical protein
MIRRKLPVWSVPGLGLIVFVFFAVSLVSGQETPKTEPDARQGEASPAAAPTRPQGVREPEVCKYSLSPENQSFSPAKGIGSISLRTGDNCAWTAASNAPWLKIDSEGSGLGSGIIKYSFSANTGATTRSAAITVAGHTFQVTQGPTPPTAQPVPAAPQHTLTIEKAGNGQGKVASNPAGTVFRKGASVTLYALPEANAVFAGWSGSCSGSSKTCVVNMSADRVVTASFSLKTHTIHARLPINGVIHPSGTVKAVHGEKRRFQIIPLPGYHVSEVLVDKVSVGSVNSYTFNNVTGDHVLEAIFVKD